MFKHPCHQRVLYRHSTSQALLQAQFMGTEHSSNDPYPNFCGAIRLAVSGMALLGARPF